MSKPQFLFLALCAVCVACGGAGTLSDSQRGLLVFNSSGGAGTPTLHRMPKNGGNMVGVAGSTAAFVGSMDQDFEVFTSDASENIIKLVNGIPTSLTSSTADFRPCVTPDGSRLAFVSNRDGNSEIYTMTGTGTNQTNVSSSLANDTFPAISADGTKVVFTSSRDGDEEIYIVDFAGTNLTRLTTNAADDVSPAFTPDGTHIIFSSNRTGTYQIFQMDLTGANVTQLTTDSNNKFHGSFSIDGNNIFYYTATGTRQIWRCDSDGSDPVQLTSSSTDVDKTATWVYSQVSTR